MMEFAKSLKILSLAGALLLAAPVIANARGGDGGGHSGGSGGSTHSGGGDGHSPGGRDHASHRGWDGDDDDDFYTDFPGEYAYGGSCAYYNERWHESGSRLWLRRYEACMHG